VDYTIVVKKPTSRVLCSYFHTPTPDGSYRHIFHSVVRAGQVKLAPEHRMESWPYPGHDLLLSFAGTSTVQIRNRSFKVNAGELIWIDYNRNHQHVRWPGRVEPWEYLCVRVDSAQLNLIAEALNVDSNPVFILPKAAAALAVYRNIFRLLRDRPLAMDAALHAVVSALTAILFEARQSAALGKRSERRNAHIAPDLTKVLSTLRAEYRRHWTVKELAQLLGCSVPQFFRRFNQATGASPMDWLRRERVNQAKRDLIETDTRIRDIAERAGYNDPHYFSRDFRKLVGVSPRHYRRRQQALLAS
jgi:AraC-like DNA-binding protein/mannose-6-phosphate isomerase-like protein (cupin superfamily)